MKSTENKKVSWTICEACQGRGKKNKRLRKKVRLQYQKECTAFENSTGKEKVPIRPKSHQYTCPSCDGSGLVLSENFPLPDIENFPHVAIIGAGIGGVALAVACLHRGIPFTLYERDQSFDSRSQGYGLTLQQASKAIKGLGIISLEEGVVSKRHVVHTTEGKVIGEWGASKWLSSGKNPSGKRTNVHIARQSLRLALLEQLGGDGIVQWGHQLANFREDDHGMTLGFEFNGEMRSAKADLVVGADGIRSCVRKLLFGEAIAPLHYLDCIVILGICPLSALNGLETSLLDSATVFQTANGHERIYMMPFAEDSVMWQLSFPMAEEDAMALSDQGPQALKKEACRRTQWHDPIPQILEATLEAQISGYPVYDRALLTSQMLEKAGPVTLIGDAAHPMSPFKGQGANQALLDALALARGLLKECRTSEKWRADGLRKSVLTGFESEMLERSASKVKASADAAQFLHSDVVLQENDGPRGRCLKQSDESK